MIVRTSLEVEYPETDGRPMGETDLHRWWMIRILDMLQHYYRGQRVYVSGDILLYYQEGDPKRFVVPDAFVVKDCEPGHRRTYKTWEEGRAPNVVFETTSRSTKREDSVHKPQLYAKLGIAEFFLFDPTADYLHPPLQGYRLVDAGYEPIQPAENGELASQELNFRLRYDDGDLVMIDIRTEKPLPTEAEYEREARLAAEAEVQRLRDELQRRDQDS